jgi:hypothetical protein
MVSPTLIVSIVGIAVSGVVGPSATAWATRVAQRRQFIRDREAMRRDELLQLLDEAASLLGLGAIRIRQAVEMEIDDTSRAWPEAVFAMGQRLRLRLGPAHEIVTTYEEVRTTLVSAGEAQAAQRDQPDSEQGVQRFESARSAFLDAAQRALDAPISDKEQR